VCRKCGEVQNIRVIDTQDEVRQFLDDDSNKKRESRTSGETEEGKLTGAGSRTQFVSGVGGFKTAYTAGLNRSIELTATVEDKTSLALAAKINEITRSLNVTDNITVRCGTRLQEGNTGKTSRRRLKFFTPPPRLRGDSLASQIFLAAGKQPHKTLFWPRASCTPCIVLVIAFLPDNWGCAFFSNAHTL